VVRKSLNGKRVNVVVAAENGECARCKQAIKPGERITNERGFASHRDCIRLGVAMPKDRRGQVSAGWGSPCNRCDRIIEQGERWTRVGRVVAHFNCQEDE
jgi:hypothetical protein